MSFKDMPLDTTLQKGDVVTITGPGEHDVLVREVTRLDARDDNAIGAGILGPAADMTVVLQRDDRTLTRIQRPITLPTVEGDYILTHKSGSRVLRALVRGVWRTGAGGKASTDNLLDDIESDATLTRVIPADEAKHPEVDVEKVIHEYWELSLGSWRDDFRVIMRRVLAGEFDL